MQLSASRAVALFVLLSAAMVPSRARAQRPEDPAVPAAPPPATVEPPASLPTAPPEAGAPPPSSSVDARATSDVAAYGDTDHVYILTPSIGGSVSSPTQGWSVEGTYLVDIVSAASADIVSTASRRWEEVRQAGTLGGTYKPGDFGVSANASLSNEPDYTAWSGGAMVTQDLLEKNLTLLAGFTHGHDVAGRSGTPFSIFSRPLDREAIKAGATFVLDRASIASVVSDLIVESGDQSKPYRYVPLFAPGTSVPNGASGGLVNSIRLPGRPLEQLPTSRDRFSVSLRYAHRYERTTLRLDERLYDDSWALKATSTDARLLLDFGRLEHGPHARVHAQTSVSFWQRAYVQQPGFDYPALRTGDRELGPLLAFTGGWTFRLGLGAAPNRAAWVLGWDLNLTETRYLDDLYVTQRLSLIAGMSLEGAL